MFYTHSTLDRADRFRKDDTVLNTLRHSQDARIVPVWHGQSLTTTMSEGSPLDALFLTSDCKLPAGQEVFLGLHGGIAYFAADVSFLDDPQSEALAAQARNRQDAACQGVFTDLRRTGPALADEDGSLLAYARGLVYWNSNTRHCVQCGTLMSSHNGGHVRRCSAEACAYQAFPRTDPAVIMLVSHTPDDGDAARCLLGRSPGWPDGVFSTLAGFVEPGETLEAAVQREVLEEASIRTLDVRYIASQPWPFPRSIMLGFEARAINTDIVCDPIELADAQWFTREDIAGFGVWGDEAPGFKLPRKDSIARYLIDRWMAQEHD